MGLVVFSSVSRGGSGGECNGNGTAGQNYGPGYKNPCIHSGEIKTSGYLPTTWYNYALASAGTITGGSNTNTAAESICSKGWTLPSNGQIDTLTKGSSSSTYTLAFSPVFGGYYINSALNTETTRGLFWGSEVGVVYQRYFMRYHDNGNLEFGNGASRIDGLYIRCVQKST